MLHCSFKKYSYLIDVYLCVYNFLKMKSIWEQRELGFSISFNPFVLSWEKGGIFQYVMIFWLSQLDGSYYWNLVDRD